MASQPPTPPGAGGAAAQEEAFEAAQAQGFLAPIELGGGQDDGDDAQPVEEVQRVDEADQADDAGDIDGEPLGPPSITLPTPQWWVFLDPVKKELGEEQIVGMQDQFVATLTQAVGAHRHNRSGRR